MEEVSRLLLQFDLTPSRRELPIGWAVERASLPSGLVGVQYTRATRPMMLTLVTLDDYGRDGLWLHSSTSIRVLRKGGPGLPRWEDLKQVHQIIHRDRPVVQLLPPQSSWLNIADCLHLFERMDSPTVPEVTWRR